MIDAVSTLSVQSGAMRGNPQSASSFVTTGAGVDKSYANLPKLGTRLYVRIDSAAERAILEVRASETGEVVNQYPSEAQIKAFQRAEKLATVRAEQAVREAQTREQSAPVREPTQQTRDVQSPDPVQSQSQSASSVIAPSPAAVSVPSADSEGNSIAAGFGGNQSVLV